MISSTVLQIIAITSMLLDHIGLYLMPDCFLLRAIGRVAFPLFAFMLAEGFKHTHSRPRYFARMLATALITQVIMYLLDKSAGVEYSHNVLYTFCFALISLLCAERGGFYLVAVPLLALAAGALECDYGTFGVLLIIGFYYADRFFRRNYAVRILAYTVVLYAMMASLTYYNGWMVQLFSLFAIVPIAFYSGEKGRRLPRLFGYVFYPAHLLVIYILRLMLF